MTRNRIISLGNKLVALGYDVDAVTDALDSVDESDSSTVIAKALRDGGIMTNDSLDDVTNFVTTAKPSLGKSLEKLSSAKTDGDTLSALKTLCQPTRNFRK